MQNRQLSASAAANFSRKYCPSGEWAEAFHHDMRTAHNYVNRISPARRRNASSPFYMRHQDQRNCLLGVCQTDTRKNSVTKTQFIAIQIFNFFHSVWLCVAVVELVLSDMQFCTAFVLIESKWIEHLNSYGQRERETIGTNEMRDVDSRYSIEICERAISAKCHLHRYERDVYDLKLCRRGRRHCCRAHTIFLKRSNKWNSIVADNIATSYHDLYTTHSTYSYSRAHIKCIVCCKLQCNPNDTTHNLKWNDERN